MRFLKNKHTIKSNKICHFTWFILDKYMCKSCKRAMNMQINKWYRIYGYAYRCTKCKRVLSIRERSLLSCRRYLIKDFLIILFSLTIGFTAKKIRSRIGAMVSKKIAYKLYKVFSSHCIQVAKKYNTKIGGPKHVVHIDETFFRRYITTSHLSFNFIINYTI